MCAYTIDRWSMIVDAVESVRQQTAPARELILVIDHNADLLRRAVAAFPDVTVVENSGRRGLSGARNSGVAAASGEIIAFLDDDAVAAPDWLATLVAGYDREEILGVGGTSTPVWEAGRPAWFPPEFDWVVGCTYTGMPRQRARVRNMIGSNMSLRRSVLERVGGFRAEVGRLGSLPAGCEETELCIRAQRTAPGHSIMFEPTAVVRHRVPPARGRWSYFVSRCYAEGRSKAIVSRIAGPRAGLATERTYVRRTLPAGVRRGLGDALRGDLDGLRRAGAITAGLAITSAGYATGLVTAIRSGIGPQSASASAAR